MGKLRRRVLYGGLGAASGLVGLTTVARCGGAACTSCLGCAGAGVGLLAIALYQRVRGAGTDGAQADGDGGRKAGAMM